MSYVLDALKKSDEERQRRTTPGIHTVHAPVEPRHKRGLLRPCLLVLSLLFNAGLLVWWLAPWQSGKPGVVTDAAPEREITVSKDQPERDGTSEAVRVATRREEQPEIEAQKAEVREIKPSLPAESALPQAAGESANVRPPGPAGAAVSEEVVNIQEKSTSKPEAKRASDPGAGRTKQSFGDRPAASQTVKKDASKFGKVDSGSLSAPGDLTVPQAADELHDRPKDALATVGVDGTGKARNKSLAPKVKTLPENGRFAPRVPQPSSKETAKAGTEAPSLETDGDFESKRGVPQLSELPSQIRYNVPNLSFSMLVYSRNPAERVARINGQVVHEGQDVAAELKLESITPDGAVFNYRGYRFHKGVR